MRVTTGAMDHPTSPPKMPVTIAPPPGAMAPWPVGVAADAHLHTPMKKSRSDEKLSDVDLEEARYQFHQMLTRERPELSKRDAKRIVRSTINKKTAYERMYAERSFALATAVAVAVVDARELVATSSDVSIDGGRE